MNEKLILSDPGAEKAVLGSCLHDNERIPTLAGLIRKPSYFHVFIHQKIWEAILDLHKEGEPVEPASVYARLMKMECEHDLGNPSYLAQLWDCTSSKPEYYAGIVADFYHRRETILALTAIREKTLHPGDDLSTTLREGKASLESIMLESIAEHDGESELDYQWHDFPLEALPATIRDFVAAASESIYCDPAFIAAPALAVVAAAIGNTRLIELKEGWSEPSVIWSCVIADASSKKSPCLAAALAPIWTIQLELAEKYKKAYSGWKDAYEIWNKKRYSWSRNGGDEDLEEKPEKPMASKIVTNDVTVEKLCELLSNNPKGIILYRDELAGWLGSFSRYKGSGGGGTDMPFWLEAFGAREYTVDRRTSDPPTITVPRLGVCVTGGIQPLVFKRCCTPEFFQSGFLFRMLLCMPPRKPKLWTEATIPQNVRQAYHSVIRDIYFKDDYYWDQPTFEPIRVKLTKAGKRAWVDFYGEWADRQNASSGETTNALAKLEAYCARIALILCVFEQYEQSKPRPEVTEGHVQRAFELTKWFANEAMRVYSMLRSPEGESDREELLRFINSIGGNITARRLLQSNEHRYKSQENCDKILKNLAESGFGTYEVSSEKGKPGRKVALFKIKSNGIEIQRNPTH